MNRKQPGQLADWTSALISFACIVTFLGVAIGSHFLFDQVDRAVDRGWVPNGIVFLTAFGVLAAYLPPAKLSRSLRVAVLLPVVHALILGLAWPAWLALSRFVTDYNTATVLVTKFPVAVAAASTLVAFTAFAVLVARRRSGEWLHGLTMVALSELLLLGLWLPISCSIGSGGRFYWTQTHPLVDDVLGRVLLTIVPPTTIALTFAAAGVIQPARLVAARRRIIAFVTVLFALAVTTRLGASAREMVLYSNLLPILLVAVIVAIASLLLFAAAFAMRSLRAQRALRRMQRSDGVILDDDAAPAFGVEITSWLRGPRIVQRPFAVCIVPGGRSEPGHLHLGGATIPVSGAHLVAALPAATTQLEVGEAYGALRPGDRVTIAGHTSATGDPFRTSAAPFAGELYIAPADRGLSGFASVALALWRPCVAYLLIVVAVAIPALAALAAT